MGRRSGSRGLGRGRGQGQARGRQRTMEIREGFLDLEIGWDVDFMPGPAMLTLDLGIDEELDGDLYLDEAEDADDNASPPDFVESEEIDSDAGLPETEAVAATASPQVHAGPAASWPDLLGSRPPLVLVRLVLHGGQIRARSSLAPPTRKAAETLAELRPFLVYAFQSGRDQFSDAEWHQLMGTQPASISERLLLLSRLAVRGNAEVSFSYFERKSSNDLLPWVESWLAEPGAVSGDETSSNEASGDESSGEAASGDPIAYKFSPNDRGLERYANKFAALPDGTPFSLRLLLLDSRGRPDPHPFKQLPMALKLRALKQILAEEARERKVFDYETYREKFQEALAALGCDIDKPTWAHIKNLFESLARNKLGDYFPDRDERQRRYDASLQADAAQANDAQADAGEVSP